MQKNVEINLFNVLIFTDEIQNSSTAKINIFDSKSMHNSAQ